MGQLGLARLKLLEVRPRAEVALHALPLQRRAVVGVDRVQQLAPQQLHDAIVPAKQTGEPVEAVAHDRRPEGVGLLEAYGRAERLPQLDSAVWLIACEGDRTIPPSRSMTVASRLKRCNTLLVPTLGHLGHEESPDTFVDIFQNVVTENSVNP